MELINFETHTSSVVNEITMFRGLFLLLSSGMQDVTEGLFMSAGPRQTVSATLLPPNKLPGPAAPTAISLLIPPARFSLHALHAAVLSKGGCFAFVCGEDRQPRQHGWHND